MLGGVQPLIDGRPVERPQPRVGERWPVRLRIDEAELDGRADLLDNEETRK